MSEQQQDRSPESLRHEYTEAVQTVRHYGNLRLALFSIFFAVIGGAGLVAFGKGQFDGQAALVARIAGFVVIAIFWMYIERLGQLFDHFTRMVVELERSLGYRQWTARPASKLPVLRAHIMFHLFFCLLTVLWLYAVFSVPLGS